MKNENKQLVSFNGQSVTFRLSIKETENMGEYKLISIYTWIYLRFYEYKYILVNILLCSYIYIVYILKIYLQL